VYDSLLSSSFLSSAASWLAFSRKYTSFLRLWFSFLPFFLVYRSALRRGSEMLSSALLRIGGCLCCG
jgi:hypothetical protein